KINQSKMDRKELQNNNPQIVVKAMCIVRNGEKLLLHRGFDEVKGEKFLRLFGGHVEFEETGEQAVRREMKEETGSDLSELKFLQATEHMFTYRGKPHHEIIFLFEGTLVDKALYDKKEFTFEDGGKTIEAGWFSKEDAEREGLPMYPPFPYFPKK
ncbi:MAG: NUDIX domain-containing protein, partial [bacterium]|nr:NUDIX domain-containing protein [bacterium]